MKRIPLTQGQYTLVDDEDYERVTQHKWYISRHTKTGRMYVVRNARRNDGTYFTQFLHHFIMRRKTTIDHINGDGLDNRKENLRVCTRQQNVWNSRKRCDGKCGFIGVRADRKKWVTRITIDGERVYLGTFDDPRDAARAYNEKALETRGEFAVLNKV